MNLDYIQIAVYTEIANNGDMKSKLNGIDSIFPIYYLI